MLEGVGKPIPAADAVSPCEPSSPAAAEHGRPGWWGLGVASGCILLGTVAGAVAVDALRKRPLVGQEFWNFDDESMPEGTIETPRPDDRVAFGRYVALRRLHCFECHSADFTTNDLEQPERFNEVLLDFLRQYPG